MNHSITNSDCPSIEDLTVLIDGNETTDLELVRHVDTCVDCQTRLDRLTEPDQLMHYCEVARAKSAEQPFLSPPTMAGDLGSFGGFSIESQVGAGGMVIVYRVRDEQLRRTVALKVLTCMASPSALARFERETHAASKLNHPNIVPIYSAGQSDDGRPYLVMPLIEGESLKVAIQETSMPFDKIATVVGQIADALHTAHQAGLIHRDVKPANILLDRVDGKAKLVDFVLVRGIDDQTLTRTEMMCGTPEYMSPEQASTETSDARCDVYSLGITLYECLTGSVPFRGKPLNILAQHRDLEPAPPCRLNKSVPRDLETICLKAIEKEPSRRYATAGCFAVDLQNYLDGRPIDARPASSLQKSWRWAKRNPRVAYLTIALATTLIGGIMMTTWLWQSSRANYIEAQENLLTARQNFDAATELVLNKTQFAFRLSHEVAARDLYRQLLQDVDQLVVFRSDDPAIRLLQPKVYLSNAEIESAVGNAEDSIELFNKSERMFQELIEEELEGLRRCQSQAESDQYLSSIEQLRQHHAGATILRGEVYHQIGDRDKALEDYRTAQEILIEFLKDVSSKTRGWQQRNHALAQVLEGHVWSDLGENDRALKCYQTAFQTLPDKLGTSKFALRYSEAKNPDLIPKSKTKADSAIIESIDKHIHAFAAHFLGRHLVATAKNSDNPESQIEVGTRLLTSSLEIRRKLSTENFCFSSRQRDFAMTLTELAKAAQQSGQFESAMERINESVEILGAMAEDSDRLELRLRLVQALIVRTSLFQENKINNGTLPDLLRARELCESVLEISPSWRNASAS